MEVKSWKTLNIYRILYYSPGQALTYTYNMENIPHPITISSWSFTSLYLRSVYILHQQLGFTVHSLFCILALSRTCLQFLLLSSSLFSLIYCTYIAESHRCFRSTLYLHNLYWILLDYYTSKWKQKLLLCLNMQNWDKLQRNGESHNFRLQYLMGLAKCLDKTFRIIKLTWIKAQWTSCL